jgi:hypothetical protein
LKFTTKIWSSGLLDRTNVRGGGGHLAEFLAHASTMIDNQADGDGRIFVPEQTDGLKCTVLVNIKIVLHQIRDSATRPVAYRCLQHYQVNFHRDSEIFLILTVAWRRNLRSGKSAENKKKDRKHQRLRGVRLSVPGSFPLSR